MRSQLSGCASCIKKGICFFFMLLPFLLFAGGEPLEIVVEKSETTVELYELTLRQMFSDSPHSYKIIKPFIDKEIEKNGRIENISEDLHQHIIQATKEALTEQQEKIETERLRAENRWTKKKTLTIASLCSLSATLITSITALIIHFSSS